VRLKRRAGEFCAACGRVLVERRSNAIYCDAACPKRGWRRTRVGLAADEFRDDGLRGSTSLEERARPRALDGSAAGRLAEASYRESQPWKRAIHTATAIAMTERVAILPSLMSRIQDSSPWFDRALQATSVPAAGRLAAVGHLGSESPPGGFP